MNIRVAQFAIWGTLRLLLQRLASPPSAYHGSISLLMRTEGITDTGKNTWKWSDRWQLMEKRGCQADLHVPCCNCYFRVQFFFCDFEIVIMMILQAFGFAMSWSWVKICNLMQPKSNTLYKAQLQNPLVLWRWGCAELSFCITTCSLRENLHV